MVEVGLAVFSGSDLHCRQSRTLGSADVGIDIVADHHGVGCRDPHVVEGQLKKVGRGLADHDGLRVGGILERRHEGADVEAYAIPAAAVAILVQRDETRAATQQDEELVEQILIEVLVEITDDDSVDRTGVRQLEAAEVRGCRLGCG